MYAPICATPCATLSCLSPTDFKKTPQTLLQGTSLRLDPQHPTGDRQRSCQPQEGDEGGEIWQHALLFFSFNHPSCSATDPRGMSHLCQGKAPHSVYMSWEGSSFVPPTKHHCGKLVLSTRPFTSNREFKSQMSAVGSRSWLHKWHCHTVQKLFVPAVMSFYLT